jgi:RNase P/RNase MRP subunit p29
MRLTGEQKRFLANELIGQNVTVENSSCKEWIGLSGSIVDETLHTFVIDTPRGRKRLSKASCAWYFPNARIRVDGQALEFRPEDRTKRLRR